MSLRLYLDEDAMDGDLVKALRSQGIELVTAFKADMVKEIDETHLRYAASERLALYSFNIRDYAVLHSNWMTRGKSMQGSSWQTSDCATQ